MSGYGDIIRIEEKCKLDLIALEYHKSKQHADLAVTTAREEEICDTLLKCYKRKNKSDEDFWFFEEAFNDAVVTALKKYDPQKGDFSNFFTKVLMRKEEDVRRKENRHNIHKHIEPSEREDEEDSSTADYEISDKSLGDPVHIYNFEMMIMQMCDVVLSQQKENKRKSGQLYYPMIFTDDMVKLLHSEDIMCGILKNNSARLNRASHCGFMSFFLDKECSKLEDSLGARVRMLSDITGDPADSGKDCRSRNSPHRLEQKVYAKFAGVTVQSMVEPMKKYDDLISIIRF